jgi:hypothetical protein
VMLQRVERRVGAGWLWAGSGEEEQIIGQLEVSQAQSAQRSAKTWPTLLGPRPFDAKPGWIAKSLYTLTCMQ